MSLVTVEGERVIACTITRPLVGAWHADLAVDLDLELAGRVSISIAEGALVLSGTVVSGGVVAGMLRLRVVGGAGGLSQVIPSRAYQGVPLRVPLVDALSSVGESLDGTSDASVLSRVLPRWTRTTGTAAQAIEELLTKSATWRVTSLGRVWVGTPPWSSTDLDYVLVEDDPAERRMVIASDDPRLDAGVTLDGRRIVSVRHTFDASKVRTEVRYQ